MKKLITTSAIAKKHNTYYRLMVKKLVTAGLMDSNLELTEYAESLGATYKGKESRIYWPDNLLIMDNGQIDIKSITITPDFLNTAKNLYVTTTEIGNDFAISSDQVISCLVFLGYIHKSINNELLLTTAGSMYGRQYDIDSVGKICKWKKTLCRDAKFRQAIKKVKSITDSTLNYQSVDGHMFNTELACAIDDWLTFSGYRHSVRRICPTTKIISQFYIHHFRAHIFIDDGVLFNEKNIRPIKEMKLIIKSRGDIDIDKTLGDFFSQFCCVDNY
ncbi:hypothetical protein GLP21_17595 [Photobacterium carnosum]|uniref:Uncharacterized protein n=1 Tax=Photobacterium carnosum TaxID=2023717 RepID=A0A2N4UWE9_9GAMM|nr:MULTISPECIES: hypothetical protein [Photobacterium]MCD9476309.1 hypothetical protein [Photobacterium phosphoreum]MCD9488093.1 hypothetical protein [Photobacterium iliopiscarium]MCD9508085.1 hypothetical protein [Photobacterium phosphoreum]MCD9539176.1 hypothetical protein [Photobacterium carnosum]MCD9542340.1 hypothetical protein [Photobacterium carnosum]